MIKMLEVFQFGKQLLSAIDGCSVNPSKTIQEFLDAPVLSLFLSMFSLQCNAHTDYAFIFL